MSFYFERIPGVELEVTNFDASVREAAPPGAAFGEPQLVLRTDQDWQLNVHWEVTGVAAPIIHGTWRVEGYMESIGAGGEFELPELDVAMGALVYNEVLLVPAAVVAAQLAPGEPSTPFKLTTTLTAVDHAGDVWPMAGFQEGPIIQFFVPQP